MQTVGQAESDAEVVALHLFRCASKIGNGIVATRSLLDVAIEIEDRDLLRRVMSLANCDPAIDHETLDRVPTGASEQDRMEMADYYGSDDDDRRGAAIIDLSARNDLSGGV